MSTQRAWPPPALAKEKPLRVRLAGPWRRWLV